MSTDLASVGQHLKRRVLILAAAQLSAFAAMVHCFVLDLGGWRHVHKAGLLDALTQYFMRPIHAMTHPSAQATQQAWHGVYQMAGLFIAMVIIGLLLKQALSEWRRYRIYRTLREWESLG